MASWMTLGQAARYLGVSEPTLRKWTDEGRIPVFRTPGGHRRYLRDELDDFRATREQGVQDFVRQGGRIDELPQARDNGPPGL
jgi:excisionase family DNA binding protein